MVKDVKNYNSQNGRKLPLVEQFYTIQGEGFHVGKPAYFIRIGGCDIGCHWCDSKITWDPEIHPLVDIEEIKNEVEATPAKSIVVTGGEPSLYNLEPLCEVLKPLGVKTFLETSGTGTFTGQWDWICLSPKKQSPPENVFYHKADELKVIIFDEEDFVWAEEVALLVSKECKLYLQPEWSMYEEIIPAVVEFVKKNPHWNVSLQAHKFMHIP